MRGRRLLVVMAGCAVGAMVLRGPLAEANAARRLPGTSFVPKSAMARLLSLGHRSTLADLVWLSAIGDLSKSFPDPQRKKAWLASVFDVIPKLEPTFSTVYSYGATWLTMIDRDPDQAIALLERGVKENPGDIHLAVELAMALYMLKSDREGTLAVLGPVVKDPRCDAMTMGFYSSLLVDGRQDFAALAQWVAWLDHPNALVRELAELHLERSKRRIALRAIDEFQLKQGRPPLTRDELRLPGLMAPDVVESVLSTLRIDATGRPSFPRCDELERKNAMRGASGWIVQFRAENGRSPTLEEVLGNRWVRLPAPPPGQRYAVAGDELVLEEGAPGS